MIVNYEPNPKCTESNAVLQRLFDEAVPQAVTLITEYLPCIRGELPWSGLYDLRSAECSLSPAGTRQSAAS